MRVIGLISCPDQKGITAGITQFIYEHNGNIVHADQHIDEQTNTFFMRVEWSWDDFSLERSELEEKFQPLAQRFFMRHAFFYDTESPRVAFFVSKPLHCLQDLLFRLSTGRLRCEIPCIISNHEDARPLAEQFQVPFFVIPKTAANKLRQEEEEIRLLKENKVDLVVLARYHQIFSKRFVDEFEQRIINIHHSFLPAFPGRRPYAQAFRKGVKIIGATAHYVTAELDQGPIIEQDTVRVSHRDNLSDLIRKGEDLERVVLSRSVAWALERKILCYGNKTVVFD